MFWQIEGVDRQTGQARQLRVNAQDEKEAVAKANEQGVMPTTVRAEVHQLRVEQAQSKRVERITPTTGRAEPTPSVPKHSFNLRPCKECGALVSFRAKACPKCGAPDPVATPAALWLGATALVLALVAVPVWMTFRCIDAVTDELGTALDSSQDTSDVNGVDLHGTVWATPRELIVTNLDAFDWVNVKMTMTSGVLGYYSLPTPYISAGEQVRFDLRYFTSGGKRFDPYTRAPEQLVLSADTPDGRRGYLGVWFSK